MQDKHIVQVMQVMHFLQVMYILPGHAYLQILHIVIDFKIVPLWNAMCSYFNEAIFIFWVRSSSCLYEIVFIFWVRSSYFLSEVL